MVTVDMLVDSRSMPQSRRGRYSVDNWGWLGRYCTAIAVVYRLRWLSADIDSNTPTLHRHFTDTSPILHRYFTAYRPIVSADISVNILSICFIDTSSLSRWTFDRQWPLLSSKSESNGCCCFGNFTVFAIFANKLLASSLFLSHFACLFRCYSCIFLTRTYTLPLQAKSSFLFVSSDRVSADASTDTLPILDRQFTDILPTHCLCYRDRLSVDLSTEGYPMIGRYVDHIAVDGRPTLARYSTDTRWIHRPRYRSWVDRHIEHSFLILLCRHIDRYQRSRPPIRHKILRKFLSLWLNAR